MFGDPIKEQEMLTVQRIEQAKLALYTEQIKANPSIRDLTVAHLQHNPILAKPMIATLAVMGVPPDAPEVQKLTDEAQAKWVTEESQKWNEINEKYRDEKVTDDMHLNIIDIVTGGYAPGGRTPEEVGKFSPAVWLIGTLDAIRESWNKWNPLPTSDILQFGGGGVPYRAQGRIWRYYQDLNRYDELLEKGYSPKTAQANIASLVNISEVPNLGKDMGDEELSQNIDFLKEAIKFSGENYIWAAAKKVFNGEAVNMDRSKRFFFESVHHDKDPKYYELLEKFNGDEQKAKDLYYLKIGAPLKELDENGEINYLSAANPNKISIWADRRTNYNDMNVTEYAQRELMGDNQLTEYSWGRYEAGQVLQQGTTPYKIASGLLDFASALPAEYFTGGLLSLGKLKKASRSVNVVETTKNQRKAQGSIRFLEDKNAAQELQELITTAATNRSKAGKNAWNKLSKAERKLITEDDWLIGTAKREKYNGLNTKIQEQLKVDRALARKHGLFNGRLQGVFAKDARKLIATPESRVLIKHFAKSSGKTLSEDPTLINWINDVEYWNWVGRQTDEVKIADSIVDMMTDGLRTSKPQYQGFKGPERILDGVTSMPKGFSNMTGSAVRKVTGSENFTMRSLGSVIGGNIRKPYTYTRGALRTIAHYDDSVQAAKASWKKAHGSVDATPESWDILKEIYKNNLQAKDIGVSRYLGFSSNFQNSLSLNSKRLLGEMSGSAMEMGNRKVATRQLANHMRQNNFTDLEWQSWMDRWLDLGDNYREQLKYSTDLMEFQYHKIKATGKQHEVIAKHIKRTVEEWNKKQKAYFKSNGMDNRGISHNIVSPGGGTADDLIEIAVGGQTIEIQVPRASILSEMSDNIFPFLNQDIVDRVVGKHFYAADFEDLKAFEATKIGAANVKKYLTTLRTEGRAAAREVNEFGWIPTNATMDDAGTKLLDFYTRKVFKPIVLLRPAFFTRIFLEEQFRIYSAGLDSGWNNPFQYLSWVFSHSEKEQAKYWTKFSEFDDIMRSPEHLAVTHQQWTNNIIKGGKYKNSYRIEMPEVKFGQVGYNKGIFNTLFKLRNDGVARYVAANGVDEDTLRWFTKGKGNDYRQDLLKKGGEDWMDVATNDDIAMAYLKSVENRIRQATGHRLEVGRDYVRFDSNIKKPGRKFTNNLSEAQLSHNIDSKDDGMTLLRRVIAEGVLETTDGQELKMLSEVDGMVQGVSRSQQKELENAISKWMDKDGDKFDLGTLFYKREVDVPEGSLFKGEELLDTALEFMFRNMMDRPINYLNRSSTFKQYRWAYIVDKFHLMDKELQQKFIREASATKIPLKVRKQLEELMGGSEKKVYQLTDYQTVSDGSKAFGLQSTQDLLYDTTKRHRISQKTRNIFPFPEVWFEMLTTWPKLLAENPKVIRRTQLTLKGGRGADALGFSGDGFFAEDPNGSGEQMFVMPFGGYMSNLIFGEDSNIKMSPRGYVTGVNLLGQGFVPGPTPMAGFAIDKVLPAGGVADELRGIFFGDFGPPTGTGFWDAIIPTSPSLQKFFAAQNIIPVGNKSEVASMRASTSIELFKLLKMENGEKRLLEAGALDEYLEQMEWKGTTANLLPDEDLTPDLIDAALRDYARDKGKQTFLFRAMAQFVLPTGFSPRYYIEDKNGKMWGTQILAKEYQNLVQEHNDDHIAAYESFIRLYGYEHTWLTTAKSTAKGGKKAYSERVLSWQQENKDVLEQLPKSAFYLLPDSPYEERSYQEVIRQYNIGEREVLSLEEFNIAANDTLGYFRYTAYKEKFENSFIPEAQKDMLFRIYRTALMQQLPGFERTGGQRQPATSKEILGEMIEKWPNLEITLKTEAGKVFVNDFLPKWQAFARQSEFQSPSGNPEWWLQSTDPIAVYMRADFQGWANEIIPLNPDFAAIWTNIITRMFRDDKEYYNA